jgi:hypothetical protein
VRTIGLLLVGLSVVSCASAPQPPTSADEHWSVVVYNRTQSPVFLFREVAACGTDQLTAAETMVSGVPIPSGVPSVGAVTIATPRGYAGTVSIVVTAGARPTVTLGDIAQPSLPPCEGLR